MGWKSFADRFLRPKRVAWMAVALVGLGLVFEAGVHHRRSVAFCYACRTERVEELRRLFSWNGPRVPFTTDVDELRPSRALADFFGPDHVHDWGWYPGPGILSGWFLRSTQCGTGPPCEVLRRYESDAAFRDRVREGIATARFTRVEFVLVLSAPDNARFRWAPEERMHAAVAKCLPFLREAGPWNYGPLPSRFDGLAATAR